MTSYHGYSQVKICMGIGIAGPSVIGGAMFFNGTLGSFVANSSFGNVGRNSTGQMSDFRQRTVDGDGGSGSGGQK